MNRIDVEECKTIRHYEYFFIPFRLRTTWRSGL